MTQKINTRLKFFLKFLSLTLLVGFTGQSSAGTWSYNTILQYSQGNYIYQTSTGTLYLYNGLAFQATRWNVTVALPIVMQNTSLVNQAGGMIFPSRGEHRDSASGPGGMHQDRMRRETLEEKNYQWGIGDTYLNGQIMLILEKTVIPSLSFTSQLKIPTASADKNFGTGAWDWSIGLAFRKVWNTFMVFGDAGFLNIGDPKEIIYKNPVFQGLGVGKFFMNNKLSIAVYSQNYSEILEGYDPPRQISAGTYYRASQRQLWSFNVTLGLSETTPDFSLSAGISIQI